MRIICAMKDLLIKGKDLEAYGLGDENMVVLIKMI